MNPAGGRDESLPQDVAAVQTINHVKDAFPSVERIAWGW
jgi:hypothetical protein